MRKCAKLKEKLMELATKFYLWILRVLSVVLLGVVVTHAQLAPAAALAAQKTDIALASYIGELAEDRGEVGIIKDAVKPMPMTYSSIDQRLDTIAYVIAGSILCGVGIWGICQDSNYGLITGSYFLVKGGICFYRAAF